MRVLLLTIILLATTQLSIFGHNVVEAYNPHNLHQALPVSTGDDLGKPPVAEHGNHWAI